MFLNSRFSDIELPKFLSFEPWFYSGNFKTSVSIQRHAQVVLSFKWAQGVPVVALLEESDCRVALLIEGVSKLWVIG